MTVEMRCCNFFFSNYSKKISVEGTTAVVLLENGGKMFAFPGSFVHAAVRGATCAFKLKFFNTLIKNNSRDIRASIST